MRAANEIDFWRGLALALFAGLRGTASGRKALFLLPAAETFDRPA